MITQWQFVESYEGDASYWSWRAMNVDGTIQLQSPSFDNYGLAVINAIKNGFQPRQQHWIVATRHSISHFRPGAPSLTVPIDEPVSPPRSRAAKPAAIKRSRISRSRVAGLRSARILAEKKAPRQPEAVTLRSKGRTVPD